MSDPKEAAEVFISRLERIDGEYVITIPHEVAVQQDLYEGQVVSIAVEPLDELAHADATQTQRDPAWKLNERPADYDHES